MIDDQEARSSLRDRLLAAFLPTTTAAGTRRSLRIGGPQAQNLGDAVVECLR